MYRIFSYFIYHSLDRIERDEEIYLEQLRASSLSYRAPSSSSGIGGSGDTSDHPNSGCYPVVGVLPSSKLMSDILLQFHQEAESIDLLGVNVIQNDDDNADGTSKSFFQKHQSQFEELFLRHQQSHRTEGHDASTSARHAGAAFHAPIQSESITVKAMSTRSGMNEHDDTSHSSSMMMMSMDSSATTFMSP